MLKPPQIKSLVAGFTCMLIAGSSYTFGTLIPYVTSFVYNSGNKQITSNQMALLLPISFIVLNIGMPLNNIPQLKFSNRITSLVSLIGICLTFVVLSFGDTFLMYLFFYGIFFGMFIGFGYLAPIKNCYEHIPNRKGLCSGVCILGLGISSLVFNFILLKLINPNDIQPTKMLDGKKIFAQQVSNNVPFALRIISVVYLAIGLIGIALLTPPESVSANQFKQPTDQQLRQSILSQQQTSKAALLVPTEPESEQSLKELITYLINKKILWQCLTLTASIPFGMFIAFNYKDYGFSKNLNDSFLTVIGSTGAVFNGIGRLFWGLMFDKFSFKLISSIINIVLMVSALLLPYIVQNQYLYLVAVCLIYFNYGGNYSVYPTHTMRIFGPVIGGKVYYIIFSGFSIGCVIQWISRYFLVQESNPYPGYTLCFYIFAGLNFISFLLSLFIKYDYVESINPQAKEQTH